MQIKILDQLDKLKKIDLQAILQKQGRKIIILALVLFLFLAYFLSLNPRRRMAEDAIYWQRQSVLARSLLSEFNSEQGVINFLEQQFKNSHRLITLPQGQDILQIVKDYAQRMNIRIVNIKAAPLRADKFKGADTVIINSKAAKTTAIEIEADAGYINLIRYLDVLYRVVPVLVSVDKLKIDKDKKNADRLKVFMELRFYSLL